MAHCAKADDRKNEMTCQHARHSRQNPCQASMETDSARFVSHAPLASTSARGLSWSGS